LNFLSAGLNFLSAYPHKPPLVVIPTGGPNGHDAGGWAPAAQFLVSRGYAVLRLNIRGSSGYGRTCHEAGQHHDPGEVVARQSG
jgi:dipeptidyl aminopeptidase/acylaminoacyl peptidase